MITKTCNIRCWMNKAVRNVLVTKEICGFSLFWKNINLYLFINFERFCWLLSSTENSICSNQSYSYSEGSHIRGMTSTPTIYTSSPFIYFYLLIGEIYPLARCVCVHFACFTIIYVLRCCKVSTFHHSPKFTKLYI